MKLARPDVFHPRIVLAGCPTLPDGDPDDAGLVGALRRRGLPARWRSWDDLETARADLVVLRAVTDYADRLEEFLAWSTSRAAQLLNGPATIAWNIDKRYLLDLADRGVPTVATDVFAPGQLVRMTPADAVVVAPAVGAGARWFTESGAARDYVHQLHDAGQTVVVQPDGTPSRTALVFLDGKPSHAVTAAGAVEPDFEVWDVGLAALGAAAEQLGITPREFLAARAEVVGGPDRPGEEAQLLRLQLIDPVLGWAALDTDTRDRQQREFALAVESALERRGLGPFSQRRP